MFFSITILFTETILFFCICESIIYIIFLLCVEPLFDCFHYLVGFYFEKFLFVLNVAQWNVRNVVVESEKGGEIFF